MVFDLAKFTYDSKNSNRFISGMNDQSSIQSRFLTQDIYLDDNDVLLASPKFDITQHFNQVTNLLSGYDALRQVYHAKMRVYKGDHEAIKRMQLGNSLVKQDSKVMANLGKNIVNTFVGTFASIPVKITYMNPDDNKSNSDNLNKEIQQILSTSNSSDVFFEWAKKADIYGRGYSVAYVKQDKDKTTHTKFSQMSPENCLVVYDNTLDHNKLFAITFQLIDGMYYGHLYTDDNIYKFSSSVSGMSTDNSTRFSQSSGQDNDNGLADTNWQGETNPFGIVPVSELPENEERSGLLDDIAPLMDQLDETFTAQHSDVMYFSNALLIVKGKTPI
ncbi:phage portal protein [Apilactobacillus timberlakei]|uniref:phage portal protein n=1 Tax=Apilactobacillus timberlakei TaxID=2008380 RepID=UPI0011275C83|nr:phage portal protein [Apilactobacillus timberlakei]TPR16658.1 phage portal protein [Apilactobacillus timberlakei]